MWRAYFSAVDLVYFVAQSFAILETAQNVILHPSLGERLAAESPLTMNSYPQIFLSNQNSCQNQIYILHCQQCAF